MCTQVWTQARVCDYVKKKKKKKTVKKKQNWVEEMKDKDNVDQYENI